MKDIEAALATTVIPYTFDGTNLIVASLPDLNDIYYQCWYQTTLSQPIGNTNPPNSPASPANQGYSIGVGTILEDIGKSIYWKLTTGETIIHWRLVKQISPQTSLPIADRAYSPVGTAGYITTWTSVSTQPVSNAECANLVRLG